MIEAIKEHQPKLLRWSTAKRRMHKCNHWIKLAPFCRENEIFFVVDMVATYGGVETKVDDWKIDIAVAGTQNVSAYLQAFL